MTSFSGRCTINWREFSDVHRLLSEMFAKKLPIKVASAATIAVDDVSSAAACKICLIVGSIYSYRFTAISNGIEIVASVF